MIAAIELAPNDSPMMEMKHLSQGFQKGYVCETKMTLGVKGSVYLGDTVIYSEDPTGRSLTYMEDMMPHYVKTEDDSRWYPKVRQPKFRQESMEPMIIYDSRCYPKVRQESMEPRITYDSRFYPKVRQESTEPMIIYDSRWYPKVWQELTEPGNNRKLNPNLCCP